MEKCNECGKGNVVKKKVPYILLGTELGKFDALVCDACSETLFEGKTMVEIQQKAKDAGLFGIAARTRVGTSGHSLDIKVPKAIATFFNIKKGQEVLIEPIDKNKFQVVLEN